MTGMLDMAARAARLLKMGGTAGGPSILAATVTSVSADGTATVDLGQGQTTTVRVGSGVSAGDAVQVLLDGQGGASVLSNETDPPSNSVARRVEGELVNVRAMAMGADEAAAEAARIAEEAAEAAAAVGAYAWNDTAGTHVADVPEDEWDAAVEDGFSDLSPERQYHNILMNYLGILLRSALVSLVGITRSAIAFFDGTGNAAANIVARFGSAGAQIGRLGESHLDLDYHSMKMVDRNGNPYFWVSDVTDREGYITETFYGDGSTREFMLIDDIQQVSQDEWGLTVFVDGDVVTSGFTRLLSGVRFASPPSSGSVVEIRYLPTTSNIKAYTIGQRRGRSTIGIFSIAEGYGTAASGNYSHAEGYNTTASDEMSHAEGYGTAASDNYSHAEGYSTTASGTASHAEGSGTKAWGDYTHTEGYGTRAENACSHAEGENTRAGGFNCHAEGRNTEASGNGSHAEGYGTKAYADNSHAEGEGTTVVASCSCGHAEGYGTRVENNRAHAEGYNTTASGGSSHAEGSGTTASGGSSHAEGSDTTASGYRSHAQNYGTIAASEAQTALGKYNVEDANGTYAVIVGNGTADDARSDALTLDWSGNAALGAVNYATCGTAASTAAKAASCGDGFSLVAGARVTVRFSYASTAAAPTLNVNSSGAKPISVNGAAASSSNPLKWSAGAVIEFAYDGTRWNYVRCVTGGGREVFTCSAIASYTPPVSPCLVLDTSDYGLYWWTA